MKFTLTINCDNDAFVDDMNGEVCRILTDLARRVHAGEIDLGPAFSKTQYRTLFDANGNDVGRVSYVRENNHDRA